MARPVKEGMDYFPHDTDARNDLKIRKLRAMFGNDGYATYFILLENIYRQKTYELQVPDDETILILAEECKVDYDKFNKILLKCIDLGLFDRDIYNDEKILTSNSIKLRSEPIETTRARKREWKKSKLKKVLDVDNKVNYEVLDVQSAQRKENESIEEESIENKTKENNNKENESIEEKSMNEICCSSSEDVEIIKYMLDRGFPYPSPIQIQKILSDIEIYTIGEVKQAIDIADNNGKHSYSYVKGILERRKAGISKQLSKEEIAWNEIEERIKRGEDPF